MAHWTQGPQWGDERRFTLQDLMVLFRMVLSEPHSGAWGTVVYDVDKDFDTNELDLSNTPAPTPIKYAVNELAYMLNIAQIEVVRDLYERGYAFPEVTRRDPVRAGMDHIRLPGDFMADESVFHVCEKETNEVYPTSLKELQGSYSEGTYYSSDAHFTYYEVRGNAGDELASGQVYPEDVLQEDDALKLPAETIKVVSVGDFVLNETDGSTSRVSEIDRTDNILILDELVGGRTDTFESLDFYSIQSAAQPYESLNLWPKLKRVKEDSVYQGVAEGWTVYDWTTPTRLRFNVPNRPQGLHPRKSRIYLAVQYDITPNANEPTFERIAGGGLAEEWENGWNEVDLLAEDEFEPGVQYYVTGMSNDYNKETGAGFTFVPDYVEVYAAARKNYVETTYTRLPIPLIQPTDMCEFAQYLVQCVIAYARVLAYLKKTNQMKADAGLMAEYESMVAKALQFLNKRGPSGPRNVFRNPSRIHRGYRYGFYVPPGYTNRVLF